MQPEKCVDCGEYCDDTEKCDQCGRHVCPDCDRFGEGDIVRCLACDDKVCGYDPATGRDGRAPAAWTPEREAAVRSRLAGLRGDAPVDIAAADLAAALDELERVRAIAVGLLDDCERYEQQWTSCPRVLAKDWACPECATPNDRLDTDIQVDPTFVCHKHAALALRRTL